jgi:hypothetical protein
MMIQEDYVRVVVNHLRKVNIQPWLLLVLGIVKNQGKGAGKAGFTMQ